MHNQIDKLLVGSDDYERHTVAELKHYTEIFNAKNPDGSSSTDTLLQWVPGAWAKVEALASERVRLRSGYDQIGHVVERLRTTKNARMISLGSGPGGIEIDIAKRTAESGATIICADLNPDLIRMGAERAAAEGLPVQFLQQDLNRLSLEASDFDIVFCHASLHHMIELEHICKQIRRALRPGGAFITVDISSRNGYLMWPETRDAVQPIFRTLPERLRINHTAYGRPVVDKEIWEMNTADSGMECIRSEDLLGVIGEYFQPEVFVPYFSLCRRFFDTMYGPNYDLQFPLDAAFLNWVWELDTYRLDSGHLRPETFFGIYKPRS